MLYITIASEWCDLATLPFVIPGQGIMGHVLNRTTASFWRSLPTEPRNRVYGSVDLALPDSRNLLTLCIVNASLVMMTMIYKQTKLKNWSVICAMNLLMDGVSVMYEQKVGVTTEGSLARHCLDVLFLTLWLFWNIGLRKIWINMFKAQIYFSPSPLLSCKAAISPWIRHIFLLKYRPIIEIHLEVNENSS